jgi:hypothetical protein
MLLYEQDLIQLDNENNGIRCYGIPATRFAEELGRKLVLKRILLPASTPKCSYRAQRSPEQGVCVGWRCGENYCGGMLRTEIEALAYSS